MINCVKACRNLRAKDLIRLDLYYRLCLKPHSIFSDRNLYRAIRKLLNFISLYIKIYSIQYTKEKD